MPRVAFSAALSLPRSEPGTVPFDRVLLNDGDHYDPETGKPESGLHRGNHGRGEAVQCCVLILAPPDKANLSLHALVWAAPYSFLHLFILTTAWVERWCGEERSQGFNSSLLGVCSCPGTVLSAADGVMNQTSNPLVELKCSRKRGKKTQQVPP